MKFPFDIPGYICGHRFTQNSRHFDSVNNRFYDLAGYNKFNTYADMQSGSPVFGNHGTYNREGLFLDNSNQWRFLNPIPWMGSMIVVLKPQTTNDNTVMKPYHFGDSPFSNNNGFFQIISSFTPNQVSLQAVTPAGGLAGTSQVYSGGNNQIIVGAIALDQSTRTLYSTKDFVSVATAVAGASNTGNALSMGWNGNVGFTGSVDSRFIRLGNNSRDNSGAGITTTADPTHQCIVFEHHFFKTNILTSPNLAATKEVYDTLKAYYGAL